MFSGAGKRSVGAALLLGILLVTSGSFAHATDAPASPIPNWQAKASIDERFSTYARLGALDDGANFGPWHVVFDGVAHGRGVLLSRGRLRLVPQSAQRLSDTNSTLVVSRESFGPTALQLNATWTAKKTTRVGVANPWETGWLVWDYVDPDHFTYLILKPNGWEVGRRDPSAPGTQRFIVDADRPVTPIGMKRKVIVSRVGERTSITVDGMPLTSFDLPADERHGSVGMYAEDAVVDWSRVLVVTPALSTPAAPTPQVS